MATCRPAIGRGKTRSRSCGSPPFQRNCFVDEVDDNGGGGGGGGGGIPTCK